MTSDIRTPLAAFMKADKERTPGIWNWWTSCSTKRLKTDHAHDEKEILYSYVASDGLSDVNVKEADMDFIAAASVLPIRELVKQLVMVRGALADIAAIPGGYDAEALVRAWSLSEQALAASSDLSELVEK